MAHVGRTRSERIAWDARGARELPAFDLVQLGRLYPPISSHVAPSWTHTASVHLHLCHVSSPSQTDPNIFSHPPPSFPKTPISIASPHSWTSSQFPTSRSPSIRPDKKKNKKLTRNLNLRLFSFFFFLSSPFFVPPKVSRGFCTDRKSSCCLSLQIEVGGLCSSQSEGLKVYRSSASRASDSSKSGEYSRLEGDCS